MALACTLAGCCHEDGTVCKDDIHLISGEINEEGNISLHFDLNTQYQGDLYVEMQPEGDEVCGQDFRKAALCGRLSAGHSLAGECRLRGGQPLRHEAGCMDKGVKAGSGGRAMFNGRPACSGQDG